MEIKKFRCWDGENMIYFDDNSRVVLSFNKISGWNVAPNVNDYKGEWLCGESQSRKDFVLMQFTGKQDKNGNDIYEGDVFCNIKNGKWRVLQKPILKFEDAAYLLCSQDHDFKYELLRYYESDYELEVIGNVYENPELLTPPTV